jgi:hypothetical protein
VAPRRYRQHRPFIGALALLAGAFAAAPAQAGPCDAAEHRHPGHGDGPGAAPLVVGDSVLLGAVGPVARAGFEVDAKGCRTIDQGLSLLRRRARSGRLPGLVVLALGTNAEISQRDVRRALAAIGPDRALALRTPRDHHGHAGAGARAVRGAGRRWPERLRVLDWAAQSGRHVGWLSADGIHVTPAGAAGMARLLRPVRGLRVRVGWSPGRALAPA